MKILALDLGTNLGYAYRPSLGSPGPVVYGSKTFDNSGHGGIGLRYLKFRRWLNDFKASVDGVDAVYYEEVRRHIGTNAAHVYGGFLAILTAWCEHHGITYQGVGVGTLKKHATGSGRADKKAMIKAMKTAGFKPENDNEADALAILQWAKSDLADDIKKA